MSLSKLECLPNVSEFCIRETTSDESDDVSEASGFSSSSGETQRCMEDLVEKQNEEGIFGRIWKDEGIFGTIWKVYLKAVVVLFVLFLSLTNKG